MKAVCFIPGIMGSELREGDDKFWPPDVSEALSELAEEKIVRLLNPTPLEAPQVLGRVCIKDIYVNILREIRHAGYRDAGEKRLTELPYDWRQDIVEFIAPNSPPA